MEKFIKDSMRTQKTMEQDFTTKPGDVFTIKAHSNIICNTITVAVFNGRTCEDFFLTLPNKIQTWLLLKQLSERCSSNDRCPLLKTILNA